MTMYRLLATSAMFALDGLVETNIQSHFSKWVLWSLRVRYESHAQQDIPALQAEGLGILREGVGMVPSVYDRPNGHRFMVTSYLMTSRNHDLPLLDVQEMIVKTLPVLGRIRFAAGGNFEKHHQLGKSVNPSPYILSSAMRKFNRLDTLRLVVHGKYVQEGDPSSVYSYYYKWCAKCGKHRYKMG
jgi:hypothetical protein